MLPESVMITGNSRSVEEESVEMRELCRLLFNDWMVELDFQEKQVWLWNSLVEMAKIKRRREFPQPQGREFPDSLGPITGLAAASK
ncbi:MAG: hypothetical protein WC469_01665 [Candidatus Omnitrophota bacterium]|jgi:hypothetical protein